MHFSREKAFAGGQLKAKYNIINNHCSTMSNCRSLCRKMRISGSQSFLTFPRELPQAFLPILVALVLLTLLLMPLTASPAQAAKSDKMLNATATATATATASALAGAGQFSVIYPCYIEGSVIDWQTGSPVKGATVKCIKEDQSQSWTAVTSSSGRYHISVPEGRYTCMATHSGYIMYHDSTSFQLKAPYTKKVRGAGGIVREMTISSEKSKSINISLKARPSVVLLASTSRLSSTPELEDAVSRFTDVLSHRDGFDVRYVVLDSEECQDIYGLRLDDPGNWQDTRQVLQTIAEQTGPCYIILLGGPDAIAMPATVNMGGSYWYLPSDGWYIDFDEDGLVDGGYSISRMPDVSLQCSAVAAALNSAADLHEAGGYGIVPEMRLSTQCWYPEPVGLGDACLDDDPTCGSCYATPPYGVCDECDRKEDLFRLISQSDYIFFMGHGSPESFSTNDRTPIFNVENISDVDLQSHHPIILGYFSCNTGLIYSDRPTFATELLRAGAGAFVARTTEEGTPSIFADSFEDYLKGEDGSGSYRIGDALSELMRVTVLVKGNGERRSAMQLCMYGDPTLKKNDNELYALPALTSMARFNSSQR